MPSEINIYIKDKFLLYLAGLLSLPLQKVFKGSIAHNLISELFVRRLITLIIDNLIGKNKYSQVYTFKEATYYKLVTLLIQM